MLVEFDICLVLTLPGWARRRPQRLHPPWRHDGLVNIHQHDQHADHEEAAASRADEIFWMQRFRRLDE